MPFKIGYRTLKTAVGVVIALSIAEALKLDYASSAAIITILCISVTRKNSLLVSWARFVACMIGIVISAVMFEALGYKPIIVGLFILLFIPVVLVAKSAQGIVTSSVIVMHLYTQKQATCAFFLNELQLIVIGIGTALLMNLYMPSKDNVLRRYRIEFEQKLAVILQELAAFIRDGESDWDGKEISEADHLLKESKTIALQAMENHLLREEDHYYHYFAMREKQLEIIERIMPHLASLEGAVTQSEPIADFLSELSAAVSPTNSVPYFMLRLEELKAAFRAMPLPATREEFETRSSLLYVMNEFEQYLQVKDALWSNKQDKKRPFRKA